MCFILILLGYFPQDNVTFLKLRTTRQSVRVKVISINWTERSEHVMHLSWDFFYVYLSGICAHVWLSDEGYL